MGVDNSVVLSMAEYMMLGQYMLVLISNTVLKLFSKLSKFKYLEMFLRKNDKRRVHDDTYGVCQERGFK
jgi:hypothetical protein